MRPVEDRKVAVSAFSLPFALLMNDDYFTSQTLPLQKIQSISEQTGG